MRVTVVLYGGLRAHAGMDRVAVDLDDGHPTAADAARSLGEHHPAVAAGLRGVAYVVGDEIVSGGHALHDGDILELLPPVSGGAGART